MINIRAVAILLIVVFFSNVYVVFCQEVETTEEERTIESNEITEKNDFTLSEQEIIRSIRISNDYDLLLWVRGLGIQSDNSRASLEQALLEYYNLPTDAMNPKTTEEVATDTDENEENAGTETGTETETEDEPDPLVDVEIIEETTLAEGTADEILIKHANSARYFTYEKIEEDVFTLQGNVEILVNQKSEKRQHVIIADKFVYNETTRSGTALGDVTYKVYEYTTDNPPESFSNKEPIEEFDSQIVSFNVDDFNADVLVGNTTTEKEVKYGAEKSLSDTLLFRIYSPHLSRSKDNIITVSNASFTSSKAIPPIYRIQLRKMWLLNPEEWVITNASVFIGEIPLMWIPFFVNPGDKFFFHPSIGYKTRSGGFINTTTYIIGSRAASDAEEEFLNLFNFSKQSPPQKIIKGLYLREAEPGDKLIKYPDNWLLRYLLDYYTGLGGYTALEGKFPNLWLLNTLNFNLALAFTQTVYDKDKSYFNYYIKDGVFTRNFDEGYLFNQIIPFRFGFDVSTSMKVSNYYTTSLSFALYSDSFLDRDFSQRSFDYSWDEILDPNKRIKELNTRASQKGGYYWQWNNNITIPSSKLVGNYLRSISIRNLKIQASWNRKQLPNDKIPIEYNSQFGNVEQQIESYFFYPSKVEIPSYQINASGILLSLNTLNINLRNGVPISQKRKKAQEERKKAEREQENQDSLERYPNIPRYSIYSPVEVDIPENEIFEEEEIIEFPEVAFAGVNQKKFQWNKLTLNIAYSISHSLNETIYYDSNKFIVVADVDLTDDNFIDYGYLTTNYNYSLTSTLSVLDSWLDYKYALHLKTKYRELNFDENLTDEDKETRRKSAENYTAEDLSNTHQVSLYPFRWFTPMVSSRVSYTTNFDLGKNVFSTKEEATWFDAEDEEWWNQHKISQVYNFNFASLIQKAQLDINLPPFDLVYTPSYNFSMEYVSLSLRTKITEKKDSGELLYEPLSMNLSLKFLDNNLSISSNVEYQYDLEYVKSVNSTLKVWWWNTSIYAEYSPVYEFNKDTFSFVSPNIHDKELRLKRLNSNLNYSSNPWYFWKDRISVSFNSNVSFNYDFIRFINTSFSWSYGVKFSIHQYLSLQFSTSLKNDVIYTYIEEFATQIGIEPRSLWDDIIDGFTFWDENKLRQSAFKLGVIRGSIIQDFGGWVFSFTYQGGAERVTEGNVTNYQWKNVIELSVYWKPLPEFKSEAFYREEAWSLEEEVK